MVFGIFGPLTFARQVGLMHSFDEKESINYVEHGIHLRKGLLEFTAPGLVEVSFEMEFLEGLTTAPAAGIQLVASLLRSHRAYPLVVAGRPVGPWGSRFVMTERGAAHHWYSIGGRIQHATVKVSLKEDAI